MIPADAAHGPDDVTSLSPEDVRRALHELRVHQIELEQQNEELRRMQVELDASRARYFDLYDLAPVGYVTLSERGLILEANLTVASLLGVTRTDLVKQPLSRFVFKDDENVYYLHRNQLFKFGEPQAYDVRMVKEDGTVFWAHMDVTASQDAAGEPVCRMTLSDITDRKRSDEALRDSRASLQSVADATTDAVFVKDTHGRYLLANPAVSEFVGKSSEEIVGHDDTALFSPESAREVIARDSLVMASGITQTYEEQVTVNGVLRTFLATKGPICDGQGTVVGLFGISRDITERKRSEAALHASEAKHAAMVGNISDVIGIIGVDGFMKYKSPNIEKHFGWKPSELVGTDGWLTVHPDDMARIQQEFYTLLEEGNSSVTVEYRYKCQDGSYKPIELTATNLTKDPHIGGVLLNYHDITERKRAEEALRESEREKRAILESISDAFFSLDDNMVVRYFNRGAARMLGREAADVIGQRLFDAFPEARGSVFDKAYSECIRTKTTLTFETEFAVAPYQNWYDVRVFPQQNGIAIFFQLITERKRAEAEKARLEGELHQAQKMESVGRLAGGVAHDFNNMLGVILGHTELALEQVDRAQPLHADLEEIRKAATRSADLTRQLLAFARKQTIAPKVLDLNETIANMLTMLRRLIGEDIRLVWLPGADLWPVSVDPSQIDQLLTNLCVNARDAIADIGTITLETATTTCDEAHCAMHAGLVPGDYVRLAVSDDGCGMDSETLSHLFEPFFTTKGVGKGTGLGLATVYGIVKQNHGFIDVSSGLGRGTTFTISLPRHVGKTEQVQTDVPQERATRGHETILLVEDEPAILTLTTRMLERQGYTVLAAHTPGEAIRLAREHVGEIHLLMTDVVMPEMNGRDLARNLMTLYPRLQQLFMSGYTSDVIANHGVLDEGVCFIQKPFSIKDLAAKVREALDWE